MVESVSTRRQSNAIRGGGPGVSGRVDDPARILVQVRNTPDRSLLEQWLGESYEIVPPDGELLLDQQFDLAIIDGANLKRWRSKIRSSRKEAEPAFLPFLLLASRRKGSRPTRYLGRFVDDLILRPLDEDELLARVANLLRRRRLSLELQKELQREKFQKQRGEAWFLGHELGWRAIYISVDI